MEIQVAIVFLNTGHKTLLRGSPHAVARNIEMAKMKAGGGLIRCSVTGTCNSLLEEDQLWQAFVAEAERNGLEGLAIGKYLIWRSSMILLRSSVFSLLTLMR